MRKKVGVCALAAIFAIFVQATGVTAGEAEDWPEGLQKFIFFYYKEPKPNELEKRLVDFLNSEVFKKGKLSDSDKLSMAYFFARASGKDPNIVREYAGHLERGPWEQKMFILNLLRFCGNEETEQWLRQRLDDSRYINQRQAMESMINEGLPVDINLLAGPISDARDLGLLNMEFVATGDRKVILKMIEAIETQGRLLSFFKQDNPQSPSVIRAEAKETLIFNCRIHEKALAICKEEYEKSKGQIKDTLEEIIDNIDGSIMVKRWIESKPELKPVTGAKGWALGCSAVLIEYNHGRHDTLSPGEITERSVQEELNLLSRWWSVRTRKDLFEKLNWLEEEGHRKWFEKTGQKVTQMSEEEFRKLVEQNKDDKDKVGEFETARKYYKQLGQKSIKGWDYTRYICLCRWGYQVGFISEQEAWTMIMPVAKDLQKTFDSWEDLGRNYLIGRSYWSYEEQEKYGNAMQDAFDRLIDMKSSPWNKYAWDMDLDENPVDVKKSVEVNEMKVQTGDERK